MQANTYISLNIAELEALRPASFEAVGLYLILKEKASFKTGEVGKFHRQKLTYAWFARELSRPASQGRAAKEFDTHDIQRLLAQLAHLGLVADEQWDGKRLSLCLPYSPLWQTSLPGGSEKLPQAGAVVAASIAGGASSAACLPVSLSVVKTQRSSTPFFNTDSGGETAAEPSEVPADAEAAEAARVASYAQRLKKAGGIYLDTPISREIFGSWAKRGITLDQLEQALDASLWETREPLRPGDLNKYLFPSPRQQHLGRAAL